MTKTPTKHPETNTNPLISLNLIPKLDNKLSKSRQQINQENYQKNKEQRNNQAKERYAYKKEQKKGQLSKYYGAESISILMSFGEYTELSQPKKQLCLFLLDTWFGCFDSKRRNNPPYVYRVYLFLRSVGKQCLNLLLEL